MLVLCPGQMPEDGKRLLQDYPFEMRYYHTLDPDEIREMEEQDRRDLEDYARAAELLAEDAAMEKYYDRKYNHQ